MLPRPFRWLPHAGWRHAVDIELVAYDQAATLCGEELVIPAARPTKQEWCWPTCAACDAAWRAAEGILPFPRQGGAASDGKVPGRWTHVSPSVMGL
ncbi:zinc finger protein [Saccharothrix longispora]|uniref:zinc finger protein n=1 Tax=Saccharothrix longispora TaxID=33920 RepID=UPI00286B5896|nr:zinc finger protein [Saccharothrix longispora]